MTTYVLAAFLLIFSSVRALRAEEFDTSSKGVGASAPVRKIYKKEEMHKFSGSKLKGQLKKPELSYIYQRKGLRAEQIVDVPENFNEEIINDTTRF